MNFKKLLTSAMVGLSLLNTAAPLAVHAEDVFHLGGNYELSGDAASYGKAMSEGTQFAVERRGEVLGKKIKYTEYDNTSKLDEAAKIASRLVNEKMSAIVGPATSGDVKAQIPVIDKAMIPAVAPAATVDNVTQKEDGSVYDYFFRVCFEDSYQGKAAASYAADKLSAKKAVIVEDQASDYSVGLSKAFEEKIKEKGGEVVSKQSINAGETDFSSILTNIMAQEFDVLYVPVYYNEAGLFIKQAREMGIDKPIFGGDGFHSPKLVELAGEEYATNVYFTSHFYSETEDPEVQEFLKAFQEKFGHEANTFAALAYDSANLIFDAAERAKSDDPKEIAKAIAETKDFKGITGQFSIDEKHNPVKPAIMLHLENGKYVSAEDVTAE